MWFGSAELMLPHPPSRPAPATAAAPVMSDLRFILLLRPSLAVSSDDGDGQR